jgi:hypothetical protein
MGNYADFFDSFKTKERERALQNLVMRMQITVGKTNTPSDPY